MKRIVITIAIAAATVLIPSSEAATAKPWCQRVVIIGDSLTAFGNPALRAKLPQATINARGGRMTADAWEAVEGVIESTPGWVPAAGVDGSQGRNCFVFALGTNDIYREIDQRTFATSVERLLSLVGPNDRAWWVLPAFAAASGLDASSFNAALPASVQKVSPQTPESDYMADGIHLTANGYQQRANVIALAVTGV